MVKPSQGISLSKFTQDVYQPSLKAVFQNDVIPTARKKFLKQLLQMPYELAQELDQNFATNNEVLNSVERDKLTDWNYRLNAYCTALSEQYALEKRFNRKLNFKTKEYVTKAKTKISFNMYRDKIYPATVENAFFKLVGADPLWIFEPYAQQHFFSNTMARNKEYFSRLADKLGNHNEKVFLPLPTGDKTKETLGVLMKFARVVLPILPPGKTLMLMDGRNEIKNFGIKLEIRINRNPDLNHYIDAKFINTIREMYQHKFIDNPYWDVIEEQKKIVKETPLVIDFLTDAFKGNREFPLSKFPL